jgi:hypothetical protein
MHQKPEQGLAEWLELLDLLSKCEALSSNPSATKKQNRTKLNKVNGDFSGHDCKGGRNDRFQLWFEYLFSKLLEM